MQRLFSFLIATSVFLCGVAVSAETVTFTDNLSLGASGPQVTALQRALNQDLATQVANTGTGSPGNESSYFGARTKAAVARFQEKYPSDILTPAGLTRGNGAVRARTRAKLNALFATASSNPIGTISSTTSTIATTSPAAPYLVKDSEKIDIYVGDKMLGSVQSRISSAINATITSQGKIPIKIPTITSADAPSVSIGNPSPRFGVPSTYISFKGNGVSPDSVLYFGSNYIVRSITKGGGDNFVFVVPPIPPGRYDIAVKTNGTISNTTMFVVRDPKSPIVHIQSASPTTLKYGDTLIIIGSGFTPENNIIIISGEKFASAPSTDGKTLAVQFIPKGLQAYATKNTGIIKTPLSLSVVNDYGFSDSEKTLIISL